MRWKWFGRERPAEDLHQRLEQALREVSQETQGLQPLLKATLEQALEQGFQHHVTMPMELHRAMLQGQIDALTFLLLTSNLMHPDRKALLQKYESYSADRVDAMVDEMQAGDPDGLKQQRLEMWKEVVSTHIKVLRHSVELDEAGSD